MTQFVRFRTAATQYAVDVSVVREVRRATALLPLPAPQPDVAGLLEFDGAALPVLSSLGAGTGDVLVLDADGRRFGLLVDEVLGVSRIDAPSLAPAPGGQAVQIVTGVIESDAGVVLVVDAGALAARVS